MILGALESTQWVLCINVTITCVWRHAITWHYVKLWVILHKITFLQQNCQKRNICKIYKLLNVVGVISNSQTKFDIERSKGKVTVVKKLKIFASLLSQQFDQVIPWNLVYVIFVTPSIQWFNNLTVVIQKIFSYFDLKLAKNAIYL